MHESYGKKQFQFFPNLYSYTCTVSVYARKTETTHAGADPKWEKEVRKNVRKICLQNITVVHI